jgi:hypothetical protein
VNNVRSRRMLAGEDTYSTCDTYKTYYMYSITSFSPSKAYYLKLKYMQHGDSILLVWTDLHPPPCNMQWLPIAK